MCLDEYLEPSTQFLQPEVAGTCSEGEEQVTAGEIPAVPHPFYPTPPPTPCPPHQLHERLAVPYAGAAPSACFGGGFYNPHDLDHPPKHLWATQRPGQTPNHPHNHRIHKQPFARSLSLAALSSPPVVVITNRVEKLCLCVLLNLGPTESGRGEQKAASSGVLIKGGN